MFEPGLGAPGPIVNPNQTHSSTYTKQFIDIGAAFQEEPEYLHTDTRTHTHTRTEEIYIILSMFR